MKRLCKFIPIIIGLTICFLAVAFISFFTGSEDETRKVIYVENAAELYANATKALNSGDMQLTVTANAKITTANTTYNENRSAIIRFDRSDPVDHRYHSTEELIMGTHRTAYEEYYLNGEHYQIISGVPFKGHGSIPEETFTKTLPSPVLNQDLYKQITGIQTKAGYQIEFSEASVLESWVGHTQTLLESASGTAHLSNDGQLLSCSYKAIFEYNSIRYDISIQLTPEPMIVEINLPDNNWIEITALSAPLFLERSVGILVQANSISASYQEDIYFEALGDRRNRNIALQFDGADPLSAEITTETTTTNDSRLEQSDKSVKTERFSSGKYTVQKPNEEEILDPSIDADAMTAYLHNQLISTIMLPGFIENCSKEENGVTIRYLFTGNTAFTEFLWQNAGQQLYGNPELLTGEGVSMETEYLTCYLELDSTTLFPLSSGISYFGSYTAEGLPYRFTYKADQTYQYEAQ